MMSPQQMQELKQQAEKKEQYALDLVELREMKEHELAQIEARETRLRQQIQNINDELLGYEHPS